MNLDKVAKDIYIEYQKEEIQNRNLIANCDLSINILKQTDLLSKFINYVGEDFFKEAYK